MNSEVLMNGWVWFKWPEEPTGKVTAICVNIAHISAVAGLDGKDRTALFMSSGEKHIIPNASPNDVAMEIMLAKMHVDGEMSRLHEELEREKSDQEDASDFMSDCTVEATASIDNRAVYAEYRKWATSYGLPVRSHKWLTQQLHALGYQQEPSRTNGRKWKGFLLGRREDA